MFDMHTLSSHLHFTGTVFAFIGVCVGAAEHAAMVREFALNTERWFFSLLFGAVCIDSNFIYSQN